MRRKSRALSLWCLAAVAGAAGLLAEESSKLKAVHATSVGRLPVKEGFQSIHNDDAGGVFALAEDGYKVFALEGTKPPIEKRRLPVADQVQRPFRAALSGSGRVWLLNGHQGELVLVDGDDVSTLAKPPLGEKHFGFLGSSPVAAGESLAQPTKTEGPAVAFVYSGDEWEPLVREKANDSAHKPGEITGYLLASTERGRLWIVSEYEYRVRLASPQGKVILEVQNPKISSVAPSAERDKELQELMEMHGGDTSRMMQVEAFPDSVIRAAAARSSDVYVLWRDSSSTVQDKAYLDSVDASGEVRRIEVEIPNAELIATMAAGKSGMFFAAARAEDGIFRIDWEALESATWRRVSDGSAQVSESE